MKEHIARKNKEYLSVRKEKIKKRRGEDKNFQLAEVLRSKVHKVLRGMNTTYMELIGLNMATLKAWISFQFDPDMTWDNYGRHWHIDHVLPISRFDFTDPTQGAVCFSWTNLQPLRACENQSKSNKILPHHFFNSLISAHRFIQNHGLDQKEYQRIRESLSWLRAKTSGMVTSSWMTEGF